MEKKNLYQGKTVYDYSTESIIKHQIGPSVAHGHSYL